MAPLEALPSELTDQICSYLTTSNVCALARASLRIYRNIQTALYHHPRIDTFESLTLLIRTLNDLKLRRRVSSRLATRKGIARLDITVDPAKDAMRDSRGQGPAAVLLSRMITIVTQHCPQINISLYFINSFCNRSPVSALDTEIFPRVTSIILYVGGHSQIEEWRRDNYCRPNAKFWRPLVSGMSLPDCRSIEIHHWWASPPLKGTSILDQAMECNFYSGTEYASNPSEMLGLLDGLDKLERISLESTPELDSGILGQLLSPEHSLASNLRHLELRFCNLEPDVIGKLIQQAAPVLTDLTLLLGAKEDTTFYEGEEPPHLCPLIRDFCKNLVRLEYAAPSICTAMFYDDDELQAITQNCNRVNPDQSDIYAIRETVQECRRHKRTQIRKQRVQTALREAGSKSAAQIETSTELLLDREEEQRKRLIQSLKSKWKRKIISWRGPCGRFEPWSELQQGADLAEVGVEWTLVDARYNNASRHLNGFAEDIAFDPELEESCPAGD